MIFCRTKQQSIPARIAEGHLCCKGISEIHCLVSLIQTIFSPPADWNSGHFHTFVLLFAFSRYVWEELKSEAISRQRVVEKQPQHKSN